MLQKFSLIIFALLATLQADYTIQYDFSSEVNTFYYGDDKHAKMVPQADEDGTKSEIYILDGTTYVVSHQDGMISIINLNKTKSFIDSLGVTIVPEEQLETPKFKIKKTSKKERVGGINGEVWIIQDPDSSEETRVVVTKDKKVVDATNKMFAMLSSLNPQSMDNFYQIQKGYVVIKAEGMELKSFSTKKLAKTMFELPKTQTKSKSKPQDKPKPSPAKQPNAQPQSDAPSDEQIDEAARMLKSFF